MTQKTDAPVVKSSVAGVQLFPLVLPTLAVLAISVGVFVFVGFQQFRDDSTHNSAVTVTQSQEFHPGSKEHTVRKYVFGDQVTIEPKDDPAILRRMRQVDDDLGELESRASELNERVEAYP